MRYLLKGLILVFLLQLEVEIMGSDGGRQETSLQANCDIHRIISTADLYFQIDDNTKAISMLRANLLMCEDTALHEYMKYKIAIAYMNIGQHEEALPFLRSYMAYQQSKGDSLGMARANIAWGKYYCQCKEYEKASDILFETLNHIPSGEERELEAMTFLVLAQLNVQTKVFSEAKAYAQKAMAISSSLNNDSLQLECFNFFSHLYEMMGDDQSALYYKNRSIVLDHSILRAKAAAFFCVESVNNEDKGGVEKLDSELVKMMIAARLLSFKNNELIYWGSIVLLAVFSLVFFVLFRSKMILSKKLKHKNEELEKLNATKDKFFSIIAHDLKSPFNSLMGFSELLSLQVESKSHQEIVAYSRSIYHSTRKLYSLVETLLQWSRTQLGTTEYKPERLDVKIVVSNIVSILKINAEEKDIVISVDIADDLLAWADKNLFSAVLRNLVSNAIKFSRVGSVISVSGKVKGSNIEISVKDTGIGISKDNLQKIFRVDSNHSTTGTFNEKGTGLGLVLCKEFVEINKGVISVESKLEKGSTFKFTVPLTTHNHIK
ncbi:ATP-binding protein [Saccharicrinis fermentans]|uniref:histidine kinase n=1 Tax=Saccharicrinis fermentans DSM 9555 = JCM 21142 TaxID=869213 RepID=W7YJR0_9BACT|nr:HAMP domain-containing sensor histidine kinase [Saccharicrinis fermentans]GAF04771.1 non-motile and phage-resistance protein [Saccharicrinis fermentans DSM 9555 = JCM 21142]